MKFFNIFHFNIEITIKEADGSMKHKGITVKKMKIRKKGHHEIWKGENLNFWLKI